MNYLQTFRDAAIFVALLLIPFFFLRANLRDPSQVSLFDRGLIGISAPVQYVATWAAVGVTGVLQDYVYLVDVKADNGHLRAENARLRQQMRSLEVEAQRVQELEALLDLRSNQSTQTVTARVVAKDISPSFRVVRLAVDQGGRAGVRPGLPVISVDGLVGQVRRVSGRFADVLLTADPESRVDVIVRRTGARGRLEGLGERGRYRCRIQFDRPEDQVRTGDEVITSGLGKKFPAAILVGYVSQVNEQEYGLSQEGEVTPSVDFTRLEEVLILTGTKELGPR